MNLDMHTIFVGYVFSNALCAVVMALLWRQYRGRYGGPGYWLADYTMQFLALLLVALRGWAPDWASVLLANGMVIGGTMLLCTGLERFLGRRSSPWRHYILLGVFLAVHVWGLWARPSMHIRNINASAGLLAICLQCAWLMLGRARSTRPSGAPVVGMVFAAYSLFSAFRIFSLVFGPRGAGPFEATLHDTLTILVYQMLFIALTFALFLLVIRRYRDDLENRGRELRESAALVRGLFDHMTGGAIVFDVRADGATAADFVAREINAAGRKMEGKSREEIVGRSLRELRPNITETGLVPVLRRAWQTGQPAFLPASPYHDDRGARWYEAHAFRLPSREVVAIYHDVTERQAAEEALRTNMNELARMNKLMMNREERVMELKKEVNRLLAEAGRPARFEAA